MNPQKKVKRGIWLMITLIIVSNIILKFRVVYGIDIIIDLIDLARGM